MAQRDRLVARAATANLAANRRSESTIRYSGPSIRNSFSRSEFRFGDPKFRIHDSIFKSVKTKIEIVDPKIHTTVPEFGLVSRNSIRPIRDSRSPIPNSESSIRKSTPTIRNVGSLIPIPFLTLSYTVLPHCCWKPKTPENRGSERKTARRPQPEINKEKTMARFPEREAEVATLASEIVNDLKENADE